MAEYKGYKIEIEGEPGSYSCYCPDLPGVMATGTSKKELLERMRGAMDAHIEWIAEEEAETQAQDSKPTHLHV